MTHHQEIQLPTTLAEVLDVLKSNPDPDKKRQQSKLSAISRISKYMNRPPSDIPTNIPQLRKLLASLHPAACGVKPNTLSTTKSDLASALRAVGVLQDVESKSELTPEWGTFLKAVRSTHQVWGLMRFARFCSARSIPPADVDHNVVQAFQTALDAVLLKNEPAKHIQSMIDTWNRVIGKHVLDLPRLDRLPSDRYLARSLTEYPESLQTEIVAYIDRLAQRDLFSDDGPDKPLRETSLRNTEAHLRQLLDALVTSGQRPVEFTNLSVLVTAHNLKTAFRTIMDRLGTDGLPSGLSNVAATCIAIARHHLNAPEDTIKALKDIHKRVATSPRGMSPKNAERLAQFNDWENVALLLGLPDTLMARADDNPTRRDSALAAMHAAALAILLSCPMRIKNLADLDLDKHLIPARSGTHTYYSIRIEGIEVKNGEPIEVKLNARSSKLVHRYIMQFRSQVSQANGRALFPRSSDGKSRAPSNFGSELTQRVYRETGLKVHPHLFRHIAAKLYLKERPGDFETVRRLLKHKRLQTTMDFYASLSNQWAHDHYDEVVLSKFRGTSDD
ncbi:site-specific integrase [Ruegeria arenilitoris]|uniref:site-specific integrase n=1 Tax=Ruegeria arenilitoris TaxID=1173585 RepID=UPI001481C38B|nr:site-specific integrase [Ruegeria arenilitoris]